MSRILVVDDCASQRCLIDYILRQSEQHEVTLADSVEAAIMLLSKAPFDCVVSDWQMPDEGGRDLLNYTNQHHPLLPVAIVTATGTEELAVEVLNSGAAAYLPKRLLTTELEQTVDSLVRRSINRQVNVRLIEGTRSYFQKISIGNSQDLANAAIEHFLRLAEQMELWADDVMMRIGVALHEAVTNAVIHGNLEIGSELRGVDDQAYSKLVKERQQLEPFCNREVLLSMRVAEGNAEFVITDQGPGFDVHSVANPTDEENMLKASGRGLIMMRAFMDEVQYNESGNEVRLSKKYDRKVKVTSERLQCVPGNHLSNRRAVDSNAACR